MECADAADIQTELNLCHNRLQTFTTWPLYPRPAQLAAAGFIYRGTGDRVACFNCNIVLKDWRPSDAPLKEHHRVNPKCSYVRMCYHPEDKGVDVCDC